MNDEMIEIKKSGDSNEPAEVIAPTEAATPPARTSTLVHFIWASAFVASLAMTIFGLVPMIMAAMAAREAKAVMVRGFDGLAEALKPGISAHNIYSQTLASSDPTGKVVVHTQDVDVELFKEEEKRIISDLLPWGKANVRLKVMGNRVQYFVPLDKLSATNFVFDRRSNVLTVEVPPVKLDQEMVSVQSNPEKILEEKNGSWLPFGANVEKISLEARSELKDQVILAANHVLIRQQARQAAQAKLEQLFSLMRNSLGENVKLQIYLP